MPILATSLRLNAGPIDYVLIAVYFALVLGIGAMARRSVSSSLVVTQRRGAGLFDLRLIIALLFAIFGLVVTITGLVVKAKDVSATGVDVGVNVNLWTGIPMLILALLMALWAFLRPVSMPAEEDSQG